MFRRRFVSTSALALAALLTTTVVTAEAQTAPYTYAGYAQAQALGATILGQELAAGRATAIIGSQPHATASGTGLLLAALTQGASAAANSGTDGIDGTATPVCTPEDLLEALTGALPLNLDLGLGCSSAQTAIANGFPSATATGTVTDTTANNPLAALLGDVAGVQTLLDLVGDTVDTTVISTALTLAQTVSQTTGQAINLSPVIDAIANTLDLDNINLLNLAVGDTHADTVATAAGVVSTCSAEGARLDLLDLGPTLGGPQLSIIIGDSSASVTANPDGSAPTTVITPALVTVQGPLIAALSPLSVTVGEPIEIPLPEPLGPISISVAADETGVDEEGLTFATANGVRIGLLEGEALSGGVVVDFAVCTAAATAAANVTQVTEPPAATPTTTPSRLPRTGSDDARAATIALVAALGSIGVLTLRRRQAS